MKTGVVAAFTLGFLFLGSAAIAQTPSASPVNDQSQSNNYQIISNTSPIGAGKAHICGARYYPPEAVRLGLQGQVVLAFTITTQGTVADIKIDSSSGSALLDDAAVTCARTWLYRPATQNSQPIAVPWKASVRWSLSPRVTADGPLVCPSTMLPADGSIKPNGKLVTLLFHVTIHGTVQDVMIERSSGDDQLDQIAIKCVSQWHYIPPPDETLWAAITHVPLENGETIVTTEYIIPPYQFGPGASCKRPTAVPTPSGDTVVVADLTSDGIPTNVRVWQSSGNSQLDDYAVSCVPSLRFVPAIWNGRPTPVIIPIRFDWN